jgi:hypothetical protein
MKYLKPFICLAMGIIFCLLSFSLVLGEGCEKPMGFEFYTSKANVEIGMTKNYGTPWLKEKGYTSWLNIKNNLIYSCLFQNDKLVGVSITHAIPENTDGILKTKSVHLVMLKEVNNNKQWIFEKDIYEETPDKNTKIMGALFYCTLNPKEKLFVSMTRTLSVRMLSTDIAHYIDNIDMTKP